MLKLVVILLAAAIFIYYAVVVFEDSFGPNWQESRVERATLA